MSASDTPSAPAASHWSARNLFLLGLLTLFWGINWPVMKFGVHQLPPLFFRAMGMLGGLASLYAYARWRGISLAINRPLARQIVILAIPNMVIWHLFAIYAVASLSSGRAAILGYTMPVFAMLAAWGLNGERPHWRQWLGVAAAAAATGLLLSSEFDKIAGAPLGTLIMLIAAASWGIGTAMLKRTHLEIDTLALTFWMLAVATVAVIIGATVIELPRWRMPTPGEWAAVVYNALIVFGLCHVIWFSIARALPPVASSLSLMLIPVLGVFSGAVALGEHPFWQDYAAIVLVLIALTSVLNLRRPAPEPQE